MKRPIAIGLSPNATSEDVALATSLLFRPWKYINGNSVMLLEQWFRQFFHVSHAISFVSGRGALYAILQAMGVGKNDEIIMQSFTCAVVADAIIARGATPVYVDITSSLTIDPSKIEAAITKKTKALLIQHTFGIPSDMDAISRIAKAHKLPIIEDVAHVIGGTYNKKLLGTIGDVAFFSFGRDKAFSSVFGGMAITSDATLGKKIRSVQRVQKNPSLFWIAQQLLHPIAFAAILPLYDVLSLGKALLVVLQKVGVLSFPVSANEKRGGFDRGMLAKLPNALANLALIQVRRIKQYNEKRETLAGIYTKELSNPLFSLPVSDAVFLRFPVLIAHGRDEVLAYLKKRQIYLGKWYAECIDPVGTDYEKLQYKRSSYPQTIAVSGQILNLPTYPTMEIEDAKKIVQLLNKYDNR